MSLYSRHPRFAATLLLLILISSILFLTSWSSADSYLRSPSKLRNVYSPHLSLQKQIEENEKVYQETVTQRQTMILKWGPSIQDIQTFPTERQHYTLWDFFLPAFKCPHRLERVGIMGDGGKWVCGMERLTPKKNCVVYSFGINGESSFEAALLERAHNCLLYGYDFSVRSFGPEIENEYSLRQRSRFFRSALGPRDAPNSDPKTFSLPSLMKRNGHDFIDILKIDIESAEFESLEAFVDHFHGAPLPFGQLQLEIHAYDSVVPSFQSFNKWWDKLEAAGLRPFFSEPNMVYTNINRGFRPDIVEYSFINIKGRHELISD